MTIMRSFFDSGVIEFCKNAIIYGMRFIEDNFDDLLLIKSIREQEKPKNDKKQNFVEDKVEMSGHLNELKYVLDCLCYKLLSCWEILMSYFKQHSKDVFSTSFDKNLSKEILNKARIKALEAVIEIMTETPKNLYLLIDP